MNYVNRPLLGSYKHLKFVANKGFYPSFRGSILHPYIENCAVKMFQAQFSPGLKIMKINIFKPMKRKSVGNLRSDSDP